MNDATDLHVAARPAPPTGGAADSKTRKDIQALRAIAVVSVVLYHLWPRRLTGGFVGVDIFFVISGYLITTHLIGAAPRRPRDFARFWGRRVLRLLPPVVVVILATFLGAIAFMPRSLWQATAHDGIGSMFYFENWRLIAQQTSYLGADAAPSPFQHFWSLSVEEQYYIIWPFVVAILGLLAVRSARRFRAGIYAGGFLVVVVISLAMSVSMTRNNPTEAYFSTFTRMWELGLGGLLAACFAPISELLRRFVRLRVGLVWVGAAGIVASLFLIKASTPFPGTAALLPTVATVLVILADGPRHRLNPTVLTESRPVQFLGDTSYAMYLWHWPLIAILPYALNHPLTREDKFLILVLALVVAGLSTRLLESPVRRARFLRGHTWRVFAMGVVGSLAVVLAASGVVLTVDRAQHRTQSNVQAQLQKDNSCFGAAALDPAHHCAATSALVTSPEFAKADRPDGITQCMNWPRFAKVPLVCKRGDLTAPSAKIAMFGNSHAAQWLPAFEAMAPGQRWEIDTYFVGLCNAIFAPQGPWGQGFNGVPGAQLPSMCTGFVHQMVDMIVEGNYSLVVMSTLDRIEPSHYKQYEQIMNALLHAGVKVLVIRDTPAPMNRTTQVPECVAENLANTSVCDGAPNKWIGIDPVSQAADDLRSPHAQVVNLNRYICRPDRCPAVVGGVIVYFDFNHLTSTYVKTLVPYLRPAVLAALR